MDKIDDFKQFVKQNPSLIKYVNNNEMTWQKFYKMYVLYDKDNTIWDNYLNKLKEEKNKSSSLSDILGWLKKIDLDSFQENISNIERVIGVIKEMGTKEPKKKHINLDQYTNILRINDFRYSV